MLRPPTLPTAVRLMNAAAKPLGRWLPPLSLREDALLGAASKRTGLSDFGEGSWREGLRTFLEALESEAALTPMGRVIARTEVLSALENRLQLRDWRSRHAEIAEERIERPVVILGMGRTGTTILHDLLAQDPAHRVPLTWEVERPCPPPERETCATDPRIAEADAQLDRTELLIPDFKKMHPMGALLPQECVRILSPEFASMAFELTYRVPGYTRWLHERADLRSAYRAHRRFLQHLQWRCPGRWVLKSPCHLWHLEAFLAEYPDALLIQTHRDPLKVLSSLSSLATTLRAMSSDRVDPLELAREWAELDARALHLSVEARERGLIDPSRILDVHFQEFVSDPFAVVRRLYDFAGFEYDAAIEARMKKYWEAHPADEHGRHEHRFADTGLSEPEERERVQRYQDFFDVPSEPL